MYKIISNNKTLEFDCPMTLEDLAFNYFKYKDIVCASIDGKLHDLSDSIDHSCSINFIKKDDDEGLSIIRHCALIYLDMLLNNYIQMLRW